MQGIDVRGLAEAFLTRVPAEPAQCGQEDPSRGKAVGSKNEGRVHNLE